MAKTCEELDELSPEELMEEIKEHLIEAVHAARHLEMPPFDLVFLFTHVIEANMDEDEEDEEEELNQAYERGYNAAMEKMHADEVARKLLQSE